MVNIKVSGVALKRAVSICVLILLLGLSPNALHGATDYISEGIEQFKAENYEEALELLKKAQQEQPATSVISYYLGITFKKIGDLKSAEKYLKESLHYVPPMKEAYVELIGTLYVSNKLEEALQWIQKAENNDVVPGQIAFLKGLVLLKDDDNSEAITAFKKAKELDPTVAQTADFQLAIAYGRERRFDEASSYLDNVVAADPKSDTATFAKEYQKELAKGKEMFKPWQVTIGMSYRYDDNVLDKPVDDIPGLIITGEKDSAILNMLRVDYRPNLGSKWFLNAQYNFLSTVYFKNETHNLYVNSLTLNPGYNLKNSAVSFPISFTHAVLRDTPYMYSLSVKPTYSWVFKPNNIVQMYMGIEKLKMMGQVFAPEENRDADRYLTGLGYVYAFSKGLGMLNIKYDYSFDNTLGSNWVNEGHKFNVGLVVPVKEKTLTGILTGEAFFQRYSNVNDVFYVMRRDDSYTGGASLIWQVMKNVTVNFNFTHSDVKSNVFIYEYIRNMYTAGIEYKL
ncbi:MAG: tetratricopeptide repeat protein [Nitrospirae bacterium]|nr:tetratricopeptide repeat protein [Nitrospirota bacterium]MBF0534147.1 tetratricopeptide repeat protein [Nitrospirota bacterium]MBF0617034.1 tetratricopeptide repeat protein [Nitrospirota bacterium]